MQPLSSNSFRACLISVTAAPFASTILLRSSLGQTGFVGSIATRTFPESSSSYFTTISSHSAFAKTHCFTMGSISKPSASVPRRAFSSLIAMFTAAPRPFGASALTRFCVWWWPSGPKTYLVAAKLASPPHATNLNEKKYGTCTPAKSGTTFTVSVRAAASPPDAAESPHGHATHSQSAGS